jgi:hypothetical protein
MSCVLGTRDQSPLQPNPTHEMEPGMLSAPPGPIRNNSLAQSETIFGGLPLLVLEQWHRSNEPEGPL